MSDDIPETDAPSSKSTAAPSARPTNEELRQRFARWYNAMQVSHDILMASLRRKVGPDGDVTQAYREWCEKYRAEKDEAMTRLTNAGSKGPQKEMPPRAVIDVLHLLWTTLERLKMPMAVVGGLALAAWNHPRATQDVDLLVFLESDDARINAALHSSGFRPRFPNKESKSLGSVRIAQWLIEPEESFVEVEVDLLFGKSEFHRNVIARSVEFPFNAPSGLESTNCVYKFASCEDLILLKLVAGRMIDLADTQTLLKRNEGLDFDYLDQWADSLEVAGEWKKLRPA